MVLKKLTLFAAVLCATIVVVWAATAALNAGTDQPPTAGAEQAPPPPYARFRSPHSARGTIPLDDPASPPCTAACSTPTASRLPRAGLGQGPDSARARSAGTGQGPHRRRGPLPPWAHQPLYRNRFQLIVDADALRPPDRSPRSAVLAFPGLDWDLGDIQVDPGRVFTGQVLDVDGKPRPDARIEPTVYRNYLGHSVEDIGPRQTLMTDAEGRLPDPALTRRPPRT